MEPTIGELRLFPFGREPYGYMPCWGQKLLIQRYILLYSVIGLTFGATDEGYFLLPDLRGRTPIGHDRRWPLGVSGGNPSRILKAEHLPPHGHPVQAATTEGETTFGDGAYLAGAPSGVQPSYTRTAGGRVPLHPDTVKMAPPGPAGAPLGNMQPYLALNWCIGVQGIFFEQE